MILGHFGTYVVFFCKCRNFFYDPTHTHLPNDANRFAETLQSVERQASEKHRAFRSHSLTPYSSLPVLLRNHSTVSLFLWLFFLFSLTTRIRHQ